MWEKETSGKKARAILPVFFSLEKKGGLTGELEKESVRNSRGGTRSMN